MRRASLALRGRVVTAGLVAIGILVSACSGSPAEQSPTSPPTGGDSRTNPTNQPTGTPSDTPTGGTDGPIVTTANAGSNGLDVRYVDKDGKIKILHVKDFQR